MLLDTSFGHGLKIFPVAAPNQTTIDKTLTSTVEGSGNPQAASLPVLGLSNLSVTDVGTDEMALLLHGLENASGEWQ